MMEMNDLIQLIQTVCETKMTKFELKDGEFKLSMTLGPRETQRPAQEEEKKKEPTAPCVKPTEPVLPEGYPYAAESADGLIMVTSPLVGVSKVARILSKVDLPDPDAPMIATNSPASTEKLTPANARHGLPPARVLYTF